MPTVAYNAKVRGMRPSLDEWTKMTDTSTPTIGRNTMPAAAIFDLDRTLILGSSAPVFARHLHEAGLGGGGQSPLMEPMVKIFELFGESWTAMQAARLFAGTAKGWPVDTVHEAACHAAQELLTTVCGFVPQLLEEHRYAGRRLVMATTSPYAFVQPLAEALGFDDVVATAWAQENGSYTGKVDGPFVWGRGKRMAIQSWAKERHIELRESFAYSDSFFDAGLLAAVGHPTAVNPDARLAVLATLRGWPIRHLDKSPGVVKIIGRELQDWFRPVNRPELWPNARFEFTGMDNIPADGSAIVVFNHRSYFDSVTVGLLMSRSGRTARFLGKKEVFDAPLVGQLARAFGGIRVVRASGSDEPLEAAATALRAGELVAMAPQGTIPRGPAFFDPVLRGRWGAARLAAMSGAPVIPVGLWGTEQVWPRNSRFPKLDGRPLITINVGPPVLLPHHSDDDDTVRIMDALAAQLPPEARVRRIPTDEELAATFPPGYKGDVTKESGRRPGTDADQVGTATPVKQRATKKAVAKKVAAKRVSPKRSPAKKTVAKKAVAKRSPAKKAATTRSKPRL